MQLPGLPKQFETDNIGFSSDSRLRCLQRGLERSAAESGGGFAVQAFLGTLWRNVGRARSSGRGDPFGGGHVATAGHGGVRYKKSQRKSIHQQPTKNVKQKHQTTRNQQATLKTNLFGEPELCHFSFAIPSTLKRPEHGLLTIVIHWLLQGRVSLLVPATGGRQEAEHQKR